MTLLFLLALITSANKVIATGTFELVLPGQWQTQDAMTFARGDDTVFVTTSEINDASPKRAAKRIAKLRRDLIFDMARGDATISEIETTGATSRFHGEDRRNGKRFEIGVVALNQVVVTVAIYRPLDTPAGGFDRLADSIISSVREPR